MSSLLLSKKSSLKPFSPCTFPELRSVLSWLYMEYRINEGHIMQSFNACINPSRKYRTLTMRSLLVTKPATCDFEVEGPWVFVVQFDKKTSWPSFLTKGVEVDQWVLTLKWWVRIPSCLSKYWVSVLCRGNVCSTVLCTVVEHCLIHHSSYHEPRRVDFPSADERPSN